MKVALLLEGRSTFSALEWTLISVFHANMFSQSVTERKGRITLVTMEVPFPAMNASHMFV